LHHHVTAGNRIAILADIHGNSIALDAVLADIQARGGADGFWLLGDYVAIGHDPIGVLERIARLGNTLFVRGNTDRYLVDSSLPWPTRADADGDPELFPLYVEVARSFAWSTGAVAAAGWLPWLQALPLDLRIVLPDGTRVLAVHASPDNDDGDGIHRNLAGRDLRDRARGADCDLLVVGHTHVPFDLAAGAIRIINPGSVSNPLPPDLRAAYALLHVENDGYDLQFHRVAYDRNAVIGLARQVNHPAADFIATLMRGERRAGWMASEDAGKEGADDL
jgi:predicted phosphodiesterase